MVVPRRGWGRNACRALCLFIVLGLSIGLARQTPVAAEPQVRGPLVPGGTPPIVTVPLTPLTPPYDDLRGFIRFGGEIHPIRVQPGPIDPVTVTQIVYLDIYGVPPHIVLRVQTPAGVIIRVVAGAVYREVYVEIPLPVIPPIVVLPVPPVVRPRAFETPSATVDVDPATRAATVRVRTDRVQGLIRIQPDVPVLVVDIPAEAQALSSRFVLPTEGLRILGDARRLLELRGPSFSLRVAPGPFLATLPEPARLAPDLELAGVPLRPEQVLAVLAEAPKFLEGLVPAGPIVELDLAGETPQVDLPLTHYPLVLGLPFDREALGEISPAKLGIYRRDDLTGAWHFIGGRVDVEAGMVYARLPALSTFTVMAYDKTFADVIGHWSRTDVETMASKHMVRGMTPATFAPDTTITRAQFTTLLVRALRLGQFTPARPSFRDVRARDWHFGYVEAAVRAGLVTGYGDGTFRPDAPVTRQEMATLVVRAAKAAGREVVITPLQELRALIRFVDREAIAGWAHGAAARAAHVGIVAGRTPAEYAPVADATRAEGAVMLFRLLRYLEEL